MNVKNREVERHAALKRLLSEERCNSLLDTYGDLETAIQVHQACSTVSSTLMPILGLIEIGLRNHADEQLTALLKTGDWLEAAPSPFSWKAQEAKKIADAKRMAQRTIYAKMGHAAKNALDARAFPNGVPVQISHARRVKKRQEAIRVSKGQHIAQLTIFFWKRLFSSDYETTLWNNRLKRVFPQKAIARPVVAGHLERIYVLRNRVAHHELTLPRHIVPALESLRFVAMNLGEKQPNPRSALMTLMAPHWERFDAAYEELQAFDVKV